MEIMKVKGLIMSYFLSKYDKQALEFLGYKTFSEAFKNISDVIGDTPSNIRCMRDEFDPYFPNGRKGWIKRQLPISRQKVFDFFKETKDEDFYPIVKHIMHKEEDPAFALLSESIEDEEQNITPSQILAGEDKLKDLGELIVATRQEIANNFVPEDVKLSEKFIKAYSDFETAKGENVEFNNSTAIITNATDQHIYVANQWFVIATYAVPLITEIVNYRNRCEEIIDHYPEMQTYMVTNHKDKKAVYKALKENESEELKEIFSRGAVDIFAPLEKASQYGELLVKFVTDYSWWLGGKGIERTNDYYVSPALGVLNLVNASQSFVATLVYSYVTNETLYRELSTITATDTFTTACSETKSAELPRVTGGKNILFYGVPGCGKSYKIKTEYCDDEDYMERVVFHPDYTNSDFIGQIMPVNEDGHISYPFIPGPFTRVLKSAVNDPSHFYYLIIEEINRGNAPAIFGDVFQLLDRTNGESEYGISNTDIARIVYGNPKRKIKIPSNLFVLATMNTADQNVFTLDTAFKRRWLMENIPNDFSDCIFGQKKLCGTEITWAEFATAINTKIIEFGKGNIGSEDARLGAYFITEDDLDNSKTFAEKVLMYLWNDAFKFNREDAFCKEYNTLESLLRGFETKHLGVFSSNIVFEKIEGDNIPFDGVDE